MNAVLGIFFFVIFGLIGMRVAGGLSTALVSSRTFESPDEVAQFTFIASAAIAAAFAIAGLIIGLLIAMRLKPRAIRNGS